MSNSNQHQNVPKNESMVRTSKRYREIYLKERATVTLSQEVVAQILFNHFKYRDTEWSGFLFYRAVEGSIAKPETLKLEVDGMYLQDVGSAAYTAFEMTGEKIIEMASVYPDFEKDECRKGLIHTHHNMSCFFSGTDQDELQDNAENHIYYLSLIVNYKGPWCARIAVQAKLKTEGSITERMSHRDDITGEWINYNPKQEEVDKEEDVLFLIDCDIVHSLDPYYVENLEKFEQAKQKARIPARTSYNDSWEGQGLFNSGTEARPPFFVATYLNAKYALIAALVNVLKPKSYYVEEYDVEDYLRASHEDRPGLGEMLVMLKVYLEKKLKKAGKNSKSATNELEAELINAIAEIIDTTYGSSKPSDFLVKEVCLQMSHNVKDALLTTAYKNMIPQEVKDLVLAAIDAIRLSVVIDKNPA